MAVSARDGIVEGQPPIVEEPSTEFGLGVGLGVVGRRLECRMTGGDVGPPVGAQNKRSDGDPDAHQCRDKTT